MGLQQAGGAPEDLAYALLHRGTLRGNLSDYEAARGDLDAALATFRALRNRLGEGQTLQVVASQHRGRRAWEEARRAAAEAEGIFREIADRWEAAGKVPRDRIKALEGRMRKVEQAIRSAEDDQWRRSDPEKSSRANDMVGLFEAAVQKLESDLEKARSADDARTVARLEENLSSQRAMLDMARKASAEFSG